MGASSSFSTHHPSMSTRRASEAAQLQKSKQPKRAHTFNKSQIDSTPKMVSKFDKPYLERCVEGREGEEVNEEREGGSEGEEGGGSEGEEKEGEKGSEVDGGRE